MCEGAWDNYEQLFFIYLGGGVWKIILRFISFGWDIYIYIYIYHRFIVRFPIGLDFPLITLPFRGC